MKLLLFALFWLPLLANANDSFAKFYKNDEGLRIDYYLDEEAQVFSRLQNALRAGEVVELRHQVQLLRDRGRWRSDKTLAQTQAVIQLSYDPLRDQYVVENSGYVVRSNNQIDVLRIIFGQKNVLLKFSKKTHLAKSNPVKITITPHIYESKQNWLGWLTLNPFGEMRPLVAEVTYLVAE